MLKYIFEFTIICIIAALGELLNHLLPLPIPASIYGMILLFVALCTKIIKLKHVEHVADFFLGIMPILFIPSTASLITRWGILKDNLVGLLVTCMLSTVIVFAVTGLIAQAIMRYREKGGK